MAKVVNITDKLSFEENPRIQIRDKEFEINADAETVLLIMGDFSDKSQTEAALSAYKRMFNEEDRNAISEMKLPFKDLMVIIEESMNLATGREEDTEGEQ